MRVLFVTPVEIASGETITALHMAEKIVENGSNVLFLSSAFARQFLEKQFPQEIREFTDDGHRNRTIWDTSLREFQPDAIVFADYPTLFFSSVTTPLAGKEEWVRSLEEIDACLVTLDHMGFAQQAIQICLGPPHLSLHFETLPAIPDRMHILLPCPMHEPSHVNERKGKPFRYWDVPLGVPEDWRQKVRRRYLDCESDYLIFHSVARWAWQSAQLAGISYYLFLPEILEYYLADLPKPVTVVSVNNGNLLKQPNSSNIRIVNLPPCQN